MSDHSGTRPGNGDEQFVILQMVQDGTISADEGGRLLEAMARASRVAQPPAPVAPPKVSTVHIVVTNQNGGRELDLNLPIALVDTGLTVFGKLFPSRKFEIPDIRQIANSGFTGKLLDINHGTDRIEISID